MYEFTFEDAALLEALKVEYELLQLDRRVRELPGAGTVQTSQNAPLTGWA
jgi:hypothetical protein